MEVLTQQKMEITTAKDGTIRGPKAPKKQYTKAERQAAREAKQQAEEEKLAGLEGEAREKLLKTQQWIKEQQAAERAAARSKPRVDELGRPIDTDSEPSDFESAGTPPKVATPEGTSLQLFNLVRQSFLALL